MPYKKDRGLYKRKKHKGRFKNGKPQLKVPAEESTVVLPASSTAVESAVVTTTRKNVHTKVNVQQGPGCIQKVTVLMSSKDGAAHTPGPSTSYDAGPRSILTFSPVSSSSSSSSCSSVLGEETAHFPKIFRKTDEEMFLRRPGTMFQQTKLRPKKEENPPEPSTKIKEDENGILQLTKISQLISKFSEHFKNSHCVKPDPQVNIVHRKGLCLTLNVLCKNCNFASDRVKMYEEIRRRSRGVASGAINDGLSLSTAKSKVGPSDLQLILSCMNIKPPSLSSIGMKMNSVCDMITEINQDTLVENQNYVKEHTEAIGCSSIDVPVETDTSYNNRIQAGYEAGTASFTPMIEQATGFSLPIAATIFNKICKNPLCCHDGPECRRNYPEEETMASTERKAILRNMDAVANENLIRVGSVTTDASAQVEKVVTDYSRSRSKVEHNLCFVHRMRTLQKNLKRVKLQNVPVPASDRDAYMSCVSSCLRSRARIELVRAKGLCENSQQKFTAKAAEALSNMVHCLCGNHTQCQRKALACTRKMKCHSNRDLPGGRPLALSNVAQRQLIDVINTTLSQTVLAKLFCLRNTNKAEIMHRRAFTYAPKNTVWSRNFAALCHSAMHSSTYGTGGSLWIMSRALSLPFNRGSPLHRMTAQRDKVTMYNNERNSKPEIKKKRFFARKKKTCKLSSF